MTFLKEIIATGHDSGTDYYHGNRTMVRDSDGHWVHLGYQLDPGTLRLYYSTDDASDTWDYDEDIELTYDGGNFPYSICVDDDDDVWVAHGRSDSKVEVTPLTKGAGPNWTQGSSESVFDLGAGYTIGRVDICTLDDDKILVAALVKNVSSVYLYYRLRKADTTWGTVQSLLLDNNSPSGVNTDVKYGGLSIAEDLTPEAGALKRWAAVFTPAKSTYHYVRAFEINTSTGVANTSKAIENKAFLSNSSQYHRAMIFATGADEWTVGAVVGTGTSTHTWASRFGWNGYTQGPSSVKSSVGSWSNSVHHARNRSIHYFNDDRMVMYWGATWGYIPSGRIMAKIVRFPTTGITWAPEFVAYEDTALKQLRDFYCGEAKNLDDNVVIFAFQGWNDGDPSTTEYSLRNYAVPIPTAPTKPTNGSTVTTDLPTVGATISSTSSDKRPRLKYGVQLATNSGFSLNYRTFEFPDTKFVVSGYSEYEVPGGSELFQGTWYMRFFQVDEYNVTGIYGSTISFTVSHPPSTTNHQPTANQIIEHDPGGNDFTWEFTDSSPTDTQTAYQVIVELNSDGSTVEDTGKVVSTDEEASIAIDGGYLGDVLRWKVRTWDSDDVAGEYSAYQLFGVYDAPTVAIDTAGTEYETPAPTITWAYTPGTAGDQTHYRVIIREDSTSETVYDTGWIAGDDETFTVPIPVLQKTLEYNTEVQVRDEVGLVGMDTEAARLATWTAPIQPTFTVSAALLETYGYIKVSWNGSMKDANWHAWRVYRRDEENLDWSLVGETEDPDTTIEMLDFLAPQNLSNDYIVIQVKLLDGAQIESDFTTYASITPAGTHYWLVDESVQGIREAEFDSGDGLAMKLAHVTEDSHAEEYEEALHKVPGRGHKRDIGTRWGYAGQLTAELRGLGGLTAREEKRQLEAMRGQRREAYLRNPFGDVFKVSLGSVGISRMSGVGVNEYCTATIPFSEVS